MHTGGQSGKFYGNSIVSVLLSLQPISISEFYSKMSVNKHKYPETMQIEARIASTEPRNVSLLRFMPKIYHGHNFSKFGPKNINFGNI